MTDTTAATPGVAFDYGPLRLLWCDSYALAWNDQGSGAAEDGGFWIPTPPPGFSPLGGLALSNYQDPNGVHSVLCAQVGDDLEALAAPVQVQWIWDDSGSGAPLDGSCWRMVPPPGYVALGDIFVSGHAAPDPASLPYRCVRENLVVRARSGLSIYQDHGSGARADLSVWEVDPLPPFPDPDAIGLPLPVGAFVANSAYYRPDQPVVVLLLPPYPEH